ncbi:SUMF1/EgtB/PvdO family nonheme iron enzyme [candidate division KSB1 bacterium]|nr:SUMF1/EgtB/PvdO family nonheme iron enzyme [candidate division KSB1 bacterium]
MNDNSNSFKTPVAGLNAIVVFSFLALTALIVVFLICSDWLFMLCPTDALNLRIESNINPTTFSEFLHADWLVLIYVLFISCFLFAFTGSRELSAFLGRFLLALSISGLLVSIVLFKSDILFWLSLLLLLAIAMTDASQTENKSSKKLLTYLSLLWIICYSYIALGTLYFSYTASAIEIDKLILGFELKNLLSLVIIASFLINAFGDALRSEKPDIPLIHQFKLPELSDTTRSVLAPIIQACIIVFNMILLLVISFANVIWYLFSLISVYLFRTGINLATQLFYALTNKKLWKSILRTLISFILIILFADIVLRILPPHVVNYLRTSYHFYEIGSPAIRNFGFISLLFLISIFVIYFVWALWKDKQENKEIRSQCLLGATMIILSFAFAGGVMYGLARVNFLKIHGFEYLGLFTFCVFLLIFLAVVSQLIKLIFASGQSEAQADVKGLEEEPAEAEPVSNLAEAQPIQTPAKRTDKAMLITALAALLFVAIIFKLLRPEIDIYETTQTDSHSLPVLPAEDIQPAPVDSAAVENESDSDTLAVTSVDSTTTETPKSDVGDTEKKTVTPAEIKPEVHKEIQRESKPQHVTRSETIPQDKPKKPANSETKYSVTKSEQPAERPEAEKPEKYEVQAIEPKYSEMVIVSGGSSMTGSDGKATGHSVYVSGFYMDKYEVTNAQFCQFLNEKGTHIDYDKNMVDLDNSNCIILEQPGRYRPASGFSNHPVQVSWDGAEAYATWAGKRLPTETEWVYAARGGNASYGFTYSGSNDASRVAWYDDNSAGKTHPVGQKSPNELGLHDMSGNVAEWCVESLSSGTVHFFRGGDYSSQESGVKIKYRNETEQKLDELLSIHRKKNELEAERQRTVYHGFRCVR